MSLFSTSRKCVNVCLGEFLIHDGELNTNPIAATDVLGPNQTVSTSDPPIFLSPMPRCEHIWWKFSDSFMFLAKLKLRSNILRPMRNE
jgi:hypothetical protein